MKRIVIIGAGYAGVLTAKKLAKKCKKHSDIDITIVDKNPFHTMLTELHEVAANRVDEESVTMSLSKIFAGRKVTVVTDTVRSIDFDGKRAVGAAGSYPYDILVLAAGSRPAFYGVPGAEQYAYTLWSYRDAVRLKERIHACFRDAVSETDPEKKKRLLTFCVAGAGFTGTETVAELAEYIPILCDKFDVDRSLVTVCNVDVLPRMVPGLPEKLSDKVLKRLTKMGVTALLNTKVICVQEDCLELQNEQKTWKMPCATVIWVAGTESCEIAAAAGQTLSSAGSGRIIADSFLRAKDDASVYVIGDNLMYTPPGEDHPVPQMVENCEQSAAVASHNIFCVLTGKGQQKEYRPRFHGVMVSLGGKRGVAYVGTPKKMFCLPSFFAMFVKHLINIVYFFQVLSWNKIFSYLKHEFFTIRNKRSFVGGHFSNRTPSFLLVPLRLWLGCVWLFEGIVKITEGWLSLPKLNAFFSGANAWYASILGSADAASGATAADAVSSATAAGESVGQVLFHFNIFGLFKAIFVSGKELADATLSDMAFKLDIPLLNTLIDSVILKHDWVQLTMQILIVTAEILIGLSLIGGLFTTPSSALSLVLQLMFVCTTGLYLNTFWMIFAAVALLYAAGSIFGLDYYVVPKLKKAWKKLPFVRRFYIYND